MSKDFFLLHIFFFRKVIETKINRIQSGFSGKKLPFQSFHFTYIWFYSMLIHDFCFKEESFEGNSYGLPANIDWSSRINPNTKLFNLPLEVRNREHILYILCLCDLINKQTKQHKKSPTLIICRW